ncbi:putative serine/threonine-protein kinase [Rhododendron vialii]|uniref:putative serine/threonine-protein kinase n=1 Tax=Rhododendron vialii TaxID=182163 RepID=UPI00265EEA47|nr:putative serine/threonine-protein kinase [Rhododendron vialii]XP_058196766.1 putative serine/threonine-protein kinase [Rhododendron vialii]
MDCSCFGASVGYRRRGDHARDHRASQGQPRRNIRTFSYIELRTATDDFHPSNKIGRGGFGTVYKGILKDGTKVAVKTLSAGSRQGVHEFFTEINTMSNVRHPNLVKLIGCHGERSTRILVYEYLENYSLDDALFGPTGRTVKLDWDRRSAICLGTARGVAYLHEEHVPHIVHRDIKASNILLDKDFKPKIGDFGLAKLFPDNITHISTKIAGTTGYLAPEYRMGGQLTMKADVYSFGVLILELVSGRRSAMANWGRTQILLLEWAWQLYEEGNLLELVDPDLEFFPKEEVIRYIKVAFFCTQAAANRRPLMSQVVEMLSKPVRLNEKLLTTPGLFHDSADSSGKTSSDKSSLPDAPVISYEMSSDPVTFTQVTPR